VALLQLICHVAGNEVHVRGLSVYRRAAVHVNDRRAAPAFQLAIRRAHGGEGGDQGHGADATETGRAGVEHVVKADGGICAAGVLNLDRIAPRLSVDLDPTRKGLSRATRQRWTLIGTLAMNWSRPTCFRCQGSWDSPGRSAVARLQSRNLLMPIGAVQARSVYDPRKQPSVARA
jgi:hypothetical protein